MEPEHNSEYLKQEYWQERFTKEDKKEWLCSWKDVKELVMPLVPVKEARILLIGIGNSDFGAEMVQEGYSNIDAIDFAPSVIEKMSQKHEEFKESLRYQVMDMMNMEAFANETFDFVIDKATMDAIVTDRKDPWNPSEELLGRAQKTMAEMHRVLKPKARFLQITFDQPHFRKPLLFAGETQEKWEIQQKNIDVGLGYFLFVMDKTE